MNLAELTHAFFEPLLNETFRVRLGTQDAPDLRLIDVSVISDPIPDVTNRHGFSLIFRGPPNVFLPQATYHFANDRAGELEFTIVPIGPDRDGLRYQAIFN